MKTQLNRPILVSERQGNVHCCLKLSHFQHFCTILVKTGRHSATNINVRNWTRFPFISLIQVHFLIINFKHLIHILLLFYHPFLEFRNGLMPNVSQSKFCKSFITYSYSNYAISKINKWRVSQFLLWPNIITGITRRIVKFAAQWNMQT